jgi:hypothetical protein
VLLEHLYDALHGVLGGYRRRKLELGLMSVLYFAKFVPGDVYFCFTVLLPGTFTLPYNGLSLRLSCKAIYQ